MSKILETTTGHQEMQLATNGAAHTRPIYGTGKLSKNRQLAAAPTTYAEATNSLSWTSTDNVTEFWITCHGSGAVSTTEDRVLFVVDASSEPVAAAWLDETLEGASTKVEFYSLPFNTRCGPFTCSSYLSRLDFLPGGFSAQTVDIVVEAQ